MVAQEIVVGLGTAERRVETAEGTAQAREPATGARTVEEEAAIASATGACPPGAADPGATPLAGEARAVVRLAPAAHGVPQAWAAAPGAAVGAGGRRP